MMYGAIQRTLPVGGKAPEFFPFEFGMDGYTIKNSGGCKKIDFLESCSKKEVKFGR